MSRKITNTGVYIPYNGITVIHKVHHKHRDLMQRIERTIKRSPTVSRFWSALPAKSYHMTLHDVDSQLGVSDEIWIATANARTDTWKALSRELDNYRHFKPVGTIRSFYHRGTIGIEVALSYQDTQVAEEIRAKLCNITGTALRRRVYHITLAYQYAEIDPATTPQIVAELETITNLITSSFPALNIELDDAELCSFNTMKAFDTWDGTVWPY